MVFDKVISNLFYVLCTCLIFSSSYTYGLEWPKNDFKESFVDDIYSENNMIKEVTEKSPTLEAIEPSQNTELKRVNSKSKINTTLIVDDSKSEINAKLLYSAQSLKIESHETLESLSLFTTSVYGISLNFVGSWEKDIEDFYEYEFISKTYSQPKSFNFKATTFSEHKFSMGSIYTIFDSWKFGGSLRYSNETIVSVDSDYNVEPAVIGLGGVGLIFGYEKNISDYVLTSWLIINYQISKSEERFQAIRLQENIFKLSLFQKQVKKTAFGIEGEYRRAEIVEGQNVFQIKDLKASFSFKWKL